MNATDALSLAKAHPDTVTALLGAAADAAKADPALIPDAIAAVETKSYTGFALKHLGVLFQLAGLISGNPALVDAIGKLAK